MNLHLPRDQAERLANQRALSLNLEAYRLDVAKSVLVALVRATPADDMDQDEIELISRYAAYAAKRLMMELGYIREEETSDGLADTEESG